MKIILTVSHPVDIQGRELCIADFVKKNKSLKHVLPFELYNQFLPNLVR